ncbi:M23 family metallopeptidase [Streptomyces mobaraensis]|uniref:M23 family metallopeptidase n=1 Tax=Streptomyces mobaraensis TaxID=35621 RepID=UPI0033C7AA5E
MRRLQRSHTGGGRRPPSAGGGQSSPAGDERPSPVGGGRGPSPADGDRERSRTGGDRQPSAARRAGRPPFRPGGGPGGVGGRPHPRRAPRRTPRRLRRASCLVLCALAVTVSPVLGSRPPDSYAAPGRLARATSDVYRLTREEARVRERYARAEPAARERRREADRLAERLNGLRFVSGVLREDAGAAARAQYRTGGFTARESSRLLDDPLELLSVQEDDTGRREWLARRLGETDDRSRALAAEARATALSWQVLDRDAARMRTALDAMADRLTEARGRLDALAAAEVAEGRCRTADRDALEPDEGERPGGDPSRRGWTRPVLGYRLSAGYGGSGANWSGTHTGQDFAVPTGTPVRSVGPGTVVSAGCGGAFGISMVIRHPGGWYSQYAHLAAPFVAPGRRVRPGEWIGLSGTTGNSTGPHLHFEVRTTPEFGSAVDPVEWLRRRGVGV